MSFCRGDGLDKSGSNIVPAANAAQPNNAVSLLLLRNNIAVAGQLRHGEPCMPHLQAQRCLQAFLHCQIPNPLCHYSHSQEEGSLS